MQKETKEEEVERKRRQTREKNEAMNQRLMKNPQRRHKEPPQMSGEIQGWKGEEYR